MPPSAHGDDDGGMSRSSTDLVEDLMPGAAYSEDEHCRPGDGVRPLEGSRHQGGG